MAVLLAEFNALLRTNNAPLFKEKCCSRLAGKALICFQRNVVQWVSYGMEYDNYMLNTTHVPFHSCHSVE